MCFCAGVKQGLGLLKRYLYVVTDDTSPDGAASSQLHILDVKNKLVAGTFNIQGLAAVVVGPAGLATWSSGGRLCRYYEVELNAQVGVALPVLAAHKLGTVQGLCAM